MAQHPSKRTLQALGVVIEEMQNLHDRPRMQQKNWVSKSTSWLPILKHAQEDLAAMIDPFIILAESHQAVLDSLRSLGLQVHQLTPEIWAYSWNEGEKVAAFPSQAKAIEAALRERLK